MQALMQQDRLDLAAIVLWTILATHLTIAGGAVEGVKLAGKDLGNMLAAMMGAMFGPVAVVPGVVTGLIILKFF